MDKPYCKECGNSKENGFWWRGKLDNGAKRFVCKVCKKWGNTGDGDANASSGGELYSFVDNGASAEASAVLDMDTINTPGELEKAMKIDTSVWLIYKRQIGKQAAWRKDREVLWIVNDGKVEKGEVRDSGKIKIVPLFNVKIWMRRKTEEIRADMALEDFKNSVKEFSIPALKFLKPKGGMLYEIEMPDIHLGKLTWGEESGEDSDLDSQVDVARKVATELLQYTQSHPIEKILLPLGNDFYNVDNNLGTTTLGTPQQEDTRWRKSFRVGWRLAAELIGMCSQVAPVDVVIVGGNHDEQRSFYLGEVLSALYKESKHISIDNSAKLRKYYTYGKNLIGLTHGYHEKTRELKDLMAMEVPQKWAETTFREWHTGDKHHKEDWVHKTHEGNNGVVIRILRSLTTPDAWHYNKGYVGVLRASEAFLWDKEKGLRAQFTATP